MRKQNHFLFKQLVRYICLQDCFIEYLKLQELLQIYKIVTILLRHTFLKHCNIEQGPTLFPNEQLRLCKETVYVCDMVYIFYVVCDCPW